ncbi:MAG TPA: efflux RND transporter periplasmic adaptor subunit [Gemmataceae bacterium]|nr:efflux RND transporter periplasmic adaptor subunit [Gemmataceae bacterium]
MPAQPEKRGRMAFWGTVLAVAIVLALVGGGIAFYLHYTSSTPETAGEKEPERALDKVVALGRIEPKESILALGMPTPDRIDRIAVKEGEHVKKGQLLAVLDSEVVREQERKVAVIQREQAEKRLQAITASGEAQIRVEEVRRDQIEQVEPLEIEAQDTKIKYLQAQEKNAQKDYERYLAAGDTIADQDKEKQRLLLNQIQTELIAAQCQHKKMLKSRELNRTLARAQLEAARAELKRSQSTISFELLDKEVDQAKERVKETQLRAPSAGKILRILVHEGELVHGQPILQLANTREMIVLTEVYETDIQRVEIGQKATITSHIFKRADALTGRVVWKGSSIGKARVVDLDPRAAVDNRIVDVKVELDQPQRVADLIGHQVRVEIATGSSDDSR